VAEARRERSRRHYTSRPSPGRDRRRAGDLNDFTLRILLADVFLADARRSSSFTPARGPNRRLHDHRALRCDVVPLSGSLATYRALRAARADEHDPLSCPGFFANTSGPDIALRAPAPLSRSCNSLGRRCCLGGAVSPQDFVGRLTFPLRSSGRRYARLYQSHCCSTRWAHILARPRRSLRRVFPSSPFAPRCAATPLSTPQALRPYDAIRPRALNVLLYKFAAAVADARPTPTTIEWTHMSVISPPPWNPSRSRPHEIAIPSSAVAAKPPPAQADLIAAIILSPGGHGDAPKAPTRGSGVVRPKS